MSRERLVGSAAMIAATLSWGSLPVIISRADAPAPVLVGLRMGFGVLALGLFLVVTRPRGFVPRTSRLLLVGLGVVLGLHWTLFFRAIQLIGAVAVIITFVFPLLVAVLAPRLISEPRESHALPLAAVGLLGTAVITASGSGSAQLIGGAIAFASAILAALLVMGARRIVQDIPGPVIAFWQEVLGLAVLLPWVLTSAQGVDIPWGWGALMGVVHTALAGLLFFAAVARIPAQEAGVLMYTEPASAVLFVWMFDAIVPTAWDAFGGVLVLGAGVATVLISTHRRIPAVPEGGGIVRADPAAD